MHAKMFYSLKCERKTHNLPCRWTNMNIYVQEKVLCYFLLIQKLVSKGFHDNKPLYYLQPICPSLPNAGWHCATYSVGMQRLVQRMKPLSFTVHQLNLYCLIKQRRKKNKTIKLQICRLQSWWRLRITNDGLMHVSFAPNVWAVDIMPSGRKRSERIQIAASAKCKRQHLWCYKWV